jgi:hypothetical protein
VQFGHEPNEVEQYLDVRYVSALEATWCLFAMDMHEKQPNVVCFVLHLPPMHKVVFNPYDDAVNVIQRAQRERTTLTGFFARCDRCKCMTIYISSISSTLYLEDYHIRMDT